MRILLGERFSRLAVLFGLLGGSFLLAPWGVSQSQVLVSYEDEMLKVIAMSGETPVVEVGGERLLVPDAHLRVEAANSFTDGSIEVVERNALMGQDFGSPFGGFFFRFLATVRAERDFEDCFVLFVVSPEKGEESYLMREIPDINTKGNERIVLTLPVNPGFGDGKFGYRIYSRGEEIRRYELDDPIVLEATRASSDSSDGESRNAPRATGPVEPAMVLKARLLDFPESLVGKSAGGYASAIYSIDQEGRALELIDVAADHGEFVPEVWKSIVETTYQPGSYNGETLVTTVQQHFFFNEFAPFSEGLEMIPYPNMKDREAAPIYSPLPNIVVPEPLTVRIELLVSKLGRVLNSRVVEGGDTAAANICRTAVEDWIFLPAIIDGYPAERAVTVPIAFDIKE